MNKRLLALGSLLGALAVALGAFGAHALKTIFPPEDLAIYETGVRYQVYHVFALLIAGILAGHFPQPRLFVRAGYFFVAGICLFSGSLYALAALHAHAISGFRFVGILTPIGGLFFIGGWILLFLGAWQKK